MNRRAPLDVFFHPRHVAIIGATDHPGSVGRSILANLIGSPFKGALYPVNPQRGEVMGLQCFPAIGRTPEKADLAVIVTPARTVPGIVAECVDAGVEAAIIISAGFREAGAKGKAREDEILREARRGKLRVVGPNCLGIMAPRSGLNATFAQSMALPGRIGFLSQSGALCTAILDWSLQESVGFSAFVSVGSMLDVGWAELIQYLGDDPETHSIAIYMESVGDARSFLSAAREVALSKPIIVIKPGRSAAAARAAASHTGALTGSDEVLDAAFRRCGVLRVNSIAELFYLAEALDKQSRPRGPRLTILTNAGGPAVLATDALLFEGGKLAELNPATIDALDRVLPPHWSHANPIDVLGDAGPERYSQALQIAANDDSTDGLLAILAPTGLADPTVIAEKLAEFAQLRAKLPGKPIIASWMGGASTAAGDALLSRAGIPTYRYPDSAARVFQSMWRYSANLRALYETPSAVQDSPASAEAQARVEEILTAARTRGRTLLTEAESKQILSLCGIPAVPTRIAVTADGAAAAAADLGYPVAVKLHSETITHKTDVGGVALNLRDESSVRSAFSRIQAAVPAPDFLGVTVQPMIRMDGYELILGSSVDAQFGPVLLFGSGGQLVEVFRDRALGLPPLNTTLARRMMERTRILTALEGVRGRKPVDLEELARLLVRFSWLVTEHPWIREIDINPLLASPEGFLALDARIVLHPPETAVLPMPAIRPYPSQYARPWTFEDGQEVLIRPIRPEDEPLIAHFHGTLSERSVYLRYFHLLDLDYRVSHDRLVRICFNDYDRELALVAVREAEILAVARLTRKHLLNEAEFAVLISDESQGRGLGTEMVNRLLEIARAEKLERVTAEILPDNTQMQAVCRQLGFKLSYDSDEGVIRAEFPLNAEAPVS